MSARDRLWEPQNIPRADWTGFPPVHHASPLKTLQRHPDYAAAKSGDARAAVRVIGDSLPISAATEVAHRVGSGHRPTLMPVAAVERSGRNKLPLAYAQWLGVELGWPVTPDVVQTRRAFHTDADAFERIASQPEFGGPVVAGQEYVIVDDTQAMGGTLTNLRGYVESRGGRVRLATTATGHALTADIALRPAMRAKLWEKFGHPLDEYLRSAFGFGIDRLTQGEAGHLGAAPSLDAIRDRLAQSRDSLRSRFHAPAVPPAPAATHDPGPDADPDALAGDEPDPA